MYAKIAFVYSVMLEFPKCVWGFFFLCVFLFLFKLKRYADGF